MHSINCYVIFDCIVAFISIDYLMNYAVWVGLEINDDILAPQSTNPQAKLSVQSHVKY